MVRPFHRVNVLTGVKSAMVLDSAPEYAALIKQANRPLLVLGPKLLDESLGGKLLLEWASEIAKAASLPICATAHVKGKLVPLGVKSDSEYDAVEIVVGEPDFDTPKHILEAAKKALDEGKTRYLDAPGLPELRTAIADRAKRENGIPCEQSNVLITPTKQAIFESIMATINEGDEVIMPDPAWVTYEPCVLLASGKAVPCVTKEEDEWRMVPDAVAELITPKTKMILFNSPSNPCGAVETHEDIRGLADLAKDHNLMVLSDAVYEKIIFDGLKHYSIGAEPGMLDRTITISGFSKTYAMTGWRLEAQIKLRTAEQ